MIIFPNYSLTVKVLGFGSKKWAYNNKFIKCRVFNTIFGIWFWDSIGAGGGSGNSFTNCILDSVAIGVQLEAANDNIFKNMVIHNAKFLFKKVGRLDNDTFAE